MPSMMPFGMSRFGSADSSAASGNCSMARNSHTAKGSAASTPYMPNGRNGPWPSGSSTAAPSGSTPIFMAYLLKSNCKGSALTKKTIRIAMATSVTMTVTLNDNATPRTLSPTKMT